MGLYVQELGVVLCGTDEVAIVVKDGVALGVVVEPELEPRPATRRSPRDLMLSSKVWLLLADHLASEPGTASFP